LRGPIFGGGGCLKKGLDFLGSRDPQLLPLVHVSRYTLQGDLKKCPEGEKNSIYCRLNFRDFWEKIMGLEL